MYTNIFNIMRKSMLFPKYKKEKEKRTEQGKRYTGAQGDFAPKMQKRALKKKKIPPENRHRLQCKSLFNVPELVSGM